MPPFLRRMVAGEARRMYNKEKIKILFPMDLLVTQGNGVG